MDEKNFQKEILNIFFTYDKVNKIGRQVFVVLMSFS